MPRSPRPQSARTYRPPIATVMLLGIVIAAAILCVGWFAGEGTIQHIATQINHLQAMPPWWVTAPMVAGQVLIVPTIALFLIAQAVMQLSPRPRDWSRAIVVGILLVLTARYILWRLLSTLNLDTPLNGVFSVGLLLLELLMLASGSIQLFLMLRVRDRRQEADRYAAQVLAGIYAPTVDILIPTYNEPALILRRTIIGCQTMDYANKQIYLLDDTRRPDIQALAAELGCHYLTRPDNRHAKAGNLNHAIAQTHGELIVVFDADFIPTQNFLTRTLGFFQNSQVALVQTPQSFYNPDPIARNLGLENVLTPEEEVFYRQIQPIRDAVGSVICAGTSFVIRRSALAEAGGFVTDSLSEDYFTGIHLSAKGYELVYLDEKLSAGLAADNMAAHATQRLRWARGTLQAFFIDSNPLTIPGLNFAQRLAHLEGLLHWFTSLARVGYLIIPLAYSFLGVIVVRATLEEILYFFLPYYLIQLTVFSWLNERSRSALLSDIYSLVLAVPLAITVIQVMLRPFSQGFSVTPKGTVRDRFSFNWNLALPLIGLFGLTAMSLWRNIGLSLAHSGWMMTATPDRILEMQQQWKGVDLGWIWSGYNLVMIGIALLILLDVPKPDPYDWFDLRRTVRLTFPDPSDRAQCRWGATTMISEGGAEIALTQPGFPLFPIATHLPVQIEILEEQLVLPGVVVSAGQRDEFPTVQVQFESLNLHQQRQLIQLLFCRPGQWKRRNSPGEIKSLLLLIQLLLRPRFLSERQGEVRAISVAQT